MAEAVLYNIAARIIWELGSSFLDEIWLLWGVKDELDKLKRTLSTIQAVLLHAEEQSVENPEVKIWLGELSEAMYVADDLVDDFSTEALRHQVMAGPKVAKEVRLFFSSSNQFAFGLKMAHKIKAARDKLDEIDADRKKFHLNERPVERAFVGPARDQTHSSPPEIVVGREVEKEAIIRDLLSSDDGQENVSVVSVVGIGGLGKTTLAQMVYKYLDEGPFKNHFELKMWVSVSVDFDVKLLVKKVLESATKQTPQNTQMDPLKNLLHDKINGRKYLMVLDDVWNEDVSKWISFKDLLAGGARGSKIVITTRSQQVALMSRSISTHELNSLSDKEAWSLFEKMALKSEQELSRTHEATRRKIVAKCCGVPLAIRAIGAMLCTNDLESVWESLQNKELSKIDVYEKNILPILKLSYNHLPSHYKHCFAYCSLYPKDSNIHVEELICLWKAQGYLKSTDSNECLQDVGFRYFMNLYRLSFFQDAEKDEFGNISSCKMHDLMHDLAISVAGDNFYASHSGGTSITDKTLHMSFCVDRNSISQDFSSLLKAKKIRTVLALVNVEMEDTKEELAMFCNLRSLRVLNLSFFNIIKLPSTIYKLKHLRHLDISWNHNMKKLPDSITNLQNLQVLRLRFCTKLMQLPNNIKKLVNLTHLENEGCYGLTHMPRGIGKLAQLQKLSRFVIAKDNIISKHSGGLDELYALNNLGGSLTILNLKYVKNYAFEFEAANLNAKKQLQSLTLQWKESDDRDDNCSVSDVVRDEMGLEALQPHQCLKRLSVEYYRGVTPPSWLPSLTNLVSVEFGNCRSIKWLPPLDQLPYLKKLGVSGLSKLERIDVGVNFENRGFSSFFPCLTHLIILDCPNLKGFVRCKPTDVGSISMEELLYFTRLSVLEIGGCPNLISMPLSPELKKLTLSNNKMKFLMDFVKRMTTSASTSNSSPLSILTQLEDLQISNTEDYLADELLQYLPSLQKLVFHDCKRLSSDDKQWQNLKVLHSVEFKFMENLVCLPKGLQYVTTLRRLRIFDCDSLAFIPEWMGNLIMLQDLTIKYCSQLSERCKNNTAEDWPKISHIPNISIEHESIQRNGCYLL